MNYRTRNKEANNIIRYEKEKYVHNIVKEAEIQLLSERCFVRLCHCGPHCRWYY